MQRLGQACRATRALVNALPEAVLQLLAQARILRLLAARRAPSRCSAAGLQEQQLPPRKTNMRQQLDLWARQVAAVRAGNLQLSCELGGLDDEEALVHLSPHADWAAVHSTNSACDVVLTPVTSARQDLPAPASAAPPSIPLTLPGPKSGQYLISMNWTPSGSHLVLVSTEFTPGHCLRVSTFQGAQLVGSLSEPLADGERGYYTHVSDGAAALTVIQNQRRESRALASTAQGTVVARLPWVRISREPSPCGLAACCAHPQPATGCSSNSPACVREGEVSLHRAPAGTYQPELWYSSWGSQAGVVLVGPTGTARALLFVDLVQQRVQHRMALPGSASSTDPGQRLGLHQGRARVGARASHALPLLHLCRGDLGRGGRQGAVQLLWPRGPVGRAGQVPGCEDA